MNQNLDKVKFSHEGWDVLDLDDIIRDGDRYVPNSVKAKVAHAYAAGYVGKPAKDFVGNQYVYCVIRKKPKAKQYIHGM